MRFFRILALAMVIVGSLGCPIVVAPSGPGWLFDFGHLFSIGHKIQQTPDGSYFVSGTFRLSNEKNRVLSVVVNSDGSLGWLAEDSAPFVEAFSERSGTSLALDSNRIVQAGTDIPQHLTNPVDSRLRVRLVNREMETLWDNLIGDESFVPLDIFLSSDGNIAVVLQQYQSGNSNSGHLLVLDVEDGQVLSFVDLGIEFARPLAGTSTLAGGFALTGRAALTTSESVELPFWYIDESVELTGEYLFELDDDETDNGTGVVEYADGDFIVVGTAGQSGVALRVSQSGELIWSRTDFLEENANNEKDEVWDVAVTPEGLIAIVGQETRFENIADFFPRIIRSSFLVLLDGEGNLIWRADLGSTNIYGLTYTQQGTFMTCGATGDFLTLIEVDMNGNIIN